MVPQVEVTNGVASIPSKGQISCNHSVQNSQKDGKQAITISSTASSTLAPVAAAAAAAASSGGPSPKAGVSSVASAAAAALQARITFQPPKTSTEFEGAWRSFAGDQNLQASYLKLLSPEHLPAIFKSSLTPQVRFLGPVHNILLALSLGI
jgi:hypothetical protein